MFQKIKQTIRTRYVNLITRLYRNFAKEQLQIDARRVAVKKGKRRYTLLIFKDAGTLETVFNIGRQYSYDDNCLLSILIKENQALKQELDQLREEYKLLSTEQMKQATEAMLTGMFANIGTADRMGTNMLKQIYLTQSGQ